MFKDVFQIFKDTCKSAYGDNRFHSYGAPSFTLKASLKYAGVKMELIYKTNDKLRLLLESNMREGL